MNSTYDTVRGLILIILGLSGVGTLMMIDGILSNKNHKHFGRRRLLYNILDFDDLISRTKDEKVKKRYRNLRAALIAIAILIFTIATTYLFETIAT